MSIAVVVASDDTEVGKTTVALVITKALREAGFLNVELSTSDVLGEEQTDEALQVAIADVAEVDIMIHDEDALLAEAGL